MTDLSLTPARRRASPLGALRQRWWLGVLGIVGGLVLGAGFGATQAASYTAEARVGVGTGSLAATAVAGYSLGAQEIAADYARSVTTDDSKATLAKTLGSGVAGISAVNASPVPSSAIIRVDVTANSSALALQATGAVTSSLVNSINAAVVGTSPASVLQHYLSVQQQLVPAQNTQTIQRSALTRAEAGGTTAAVTAAEQALDKTTLQVVSLSAQTTALLAEYQSLVSQPQQENGLRPVQSAYLVGSNQHSLIERFGLVGLVLGALLALAAAAARDTQLIRRQSRAATGTATTGRGRPERDLAVVVPTVPTTADRLLASLAEHDEQFDAPWPEDDPPDLLPAEPGWLTDTDTDTDTDPGEVAPYEGDEIDPTDAELQWYDADADINPGTDQDLEAGTASDAERATDTDTEETEPAAAGLEPMDDEEIARAPEPATYDLSDAPGHHDRAHRSVEPVTVPDVRPSPRRRTPRRPRGTTNW